MNSVPLPEITIFFDGATKGSNPGQGGAGAIIVIDNQVVSSVSNRMGFAGNNRAEYYGLILGLRELIHLYPLSPASGYNLTIKGDSELVLKQLKGEYQVRDDVLKNYFLVAKGLLEQIKESITAAAGDRHRDSQGTIRLVHVGREQNNQTDALAKKAAGMKINPRLRFFHYPCLGSFVDGEIQGTSGALKVKVAHDSGAACYTPEIYVDASVLCSLYGEDALKKIKSTGKKNLITGKAEMTILGTTWLQFSFGHGVIKVYDALVVDFLPWPLQVSLDHPACSFANVFGPNGSYSCGGDDWRLQVSERFQSHPYWTSDVMVVGAF